MNRTRLSNSIALVVDDDQSTCDIVAAILEQEGFTVVTANSGEEALDCIGYHVFDIVVTDVCMGGISGLELLERISNLDHAIKTIIMTAHGSFETVLLALQGGAYDYIEKPINDHSRVATTARKACAYAKLERDNQELLVKLKASHGKLAKANTQLLKLNKTLEQLAVIDALTGLHNRRYIDEMLEKEIALYNRYKNPFSIVLIDVDHFKQLNDTHGHVNGDLLLKAMSAVLGHNSREADVVGRYGGEEFFMLLHATDEEGAIIVAERIREQIKQPIELDNDTVTASVSIGITSLDGTQEPITELEMLKRCDLALYRAKNNGRDCVAVYEANIDDDPQAGYAAVG